MPQELRDIGWKGVTVRKHEYDNETIIAVVFGDDSSEVSVDVVDDTAVVVVGGRQLEFEVTDKENDVTVNNGILTIEG